MAVRKARRGSRAVAPHYLSPPPPPPPPQGFVHPGVGVSDAMLTFTTANRLVAPYSTNLAVMRNTYAQDLDTVNNVGLDYNSTAWVPHPQATVLRTGSGGAGSSGDKAEMTDAGAALTDALLFVYDNDRVRGNKSVEILNAWSAVLLDNYYNSNTSGDGKLVAAWCGSMFSRAGEIMRARWVPTGGDNVLNIAALQAMFTRAFIPRINAGHSGGGSNWLMSMAEACMGIAVFNEDTALFQLGMDYWRNWVSSHIWRVGDVNEHAALVGYPHSPVTTDWDVASPNLSTFINTCWYGVNVAIPWPNFIAVEEGRDPWHCGMFLAGLANGAETAWHQGRDLYGEQQDRIVGALEKYAAWVHDLYVDGVAVPDSSPYPWTGGWITAFAAPNGNLPNKSHRATLEILYNHYNGRLGLSLPNTLQCLTDFQRTGTYINDAGGGIIAERVTHRQNLAGRTFGESMPSGDESGWQQVSAVDFTTAVAVGGFVPDPNGVLTPAGLAGYNAYGLGRGAGPLLEMAPDGGHSPDGTGLTAPTQVVSVLTNVKGANGVLDYYCHSVTVGAETRPGAAIVYPLHQIGDPNALGPYFRYGFRMRCIGFTGTGFIIIPKTADAAHVEYGELDWPESRCDDGALISGWFHRAGPTRSQEAIPSDGGRNRISDWHTYWVESIPGRVNFYQDDALMLTSTTSTPDQALNLALQCHATSGTSLATVGHVQFDWVVAYRQAPVVFAAEVMHFDADTLTGADGSAVANWPDVVAGRPALVQTTSGSQPTLSVGAVNGHNAVVWADGLNKVMSVSGGAPDIFQNLSAATVFMVVSLSAGATAIASVLGASTTTAQNRVMVQARGTTGSVAAGGRRLDADALVTFDTGDAMSTTVPHLLTVRYLWASALMHVYLDGVLIGTSNPYQTAGNTSNTAGLQMFVGAAVTGTADFHHGQIMEILAWSADDDAARAATEAALITKYAIGSTPPSTWGPYGDLGTYKPGVGTSGVLAGSTLTPMAGNQTITVPNTIIENRDITGRILVQTTGVIIRNCRIRGNGAPPGVTTEVGLISFENGAVRTGLVEDCTLKPDVASDLWDGIRGHHFTARRCDISGITDGFGVMNTSAPYSDYSVHIEGNYVHDHGYRTTDSSNQADLHTHNDCIQIHGGDNIWVVGNNLQGFADPAYSDIVSPYFPATTGQCVLFAAIIGGRITNGHFTDNWIDGAVVGINTDFRSDNVTGPYGEVKRNKFGRNQHAIGGVKQTVKVAKEQTTAIIPLTGADANVFEDTGLPVTVARP